MRPINLIPEEERRSHGTTTRTGPLAYLIVGALAILLIGVIVLVLTNNQISDRKDEVTTLEAQRTAAVAKAEALAPYVNFQQVAESRTQTVAELADGRFDWVRVIRQLSLILPPRVYLNAMTASAGEGSEETGVSVPALTIDGCAPSQNTVAAFVAALKEIDGVTRVGLSSSAKGGSEGGEGGSGNRTGCEAAGVFVFHMTVTFDGAPASPDSGGVVPAVEAPAEEEPAEGETEESGSTESSEAEPAPENTVSATATEPVG